MLHSEPNLRYGSPAEPMKVAVDGSSKTSQLDGSQPSTRNRPASSSLSSVPSEHDCSVKSPSVLGWRTDSVPSIDPADVIESYTTNPRPGHVAVVDHCKNRRSLCLDEDPKSKAIVDKLRQA